MRWRLWHSPTIFPLRISRAANRSGVPFRRSSWVWRSKIPLRRRRIDWVRSKAWDLGILVDAEYEDMLGRIEVGADDVPGLLLEVFVRAKLVVLESVGLVPTSPPDLMNHIGTDPESGRPSFESTSGWRSRAGCGACHVRWPGGWNPGVAVVPRPNGRLSRGREDEDGRSGGARERRCWPDAELLGDCLFWTRSAALRTILARRTRRFGAEWPRAHRSRLVRSSDVRESTGATCTKGAPRAQLSPQPFRGHYTRSP